MSSLQYVIDLINQAYEWLNERLENAGLKAQASSSKALDVGDLDHHRLLRDQPAALGTIQRVARIEGNPCTFKAGKLLNGHLIGSR